MTMSVFARHMFAYSSLNIPQSSPQLDMPHHSDASPSFQDNQFIDQVALVCKVYIVFR